MCGSKENPHCLRRLDGARRLFLFSHQIIKTTIDELLAPLAGHSGVQATRNTNVAQPSLRQRNLRSPNVNADTLSSSFPTRLQCRTTSNERIKHDISGIRTRLHKMLCQFQWKWGFCLVGKWMAQLSTTDCYPDNVSWTCKFVERTRAFYSPLAVVISLRERT